MALLNEIRHGLFLPKYDYNFNRPQFTTKLVNTIRIFALQFGLAIILGIIISIVAQAINYDLENNQINQAVEQLSVPMIIFLTVIFAPFTEEISFRLALKYSPFRFGIAFSFTILTVLGILEQFHIYTISFLRVRLDLLEPFAYTLVYIGAGLFVGLLFGIILKAFTSQQAIEKIYKRLFPLLFYFSVIAFGLIHITNYVGFEKIWMYTPILVMPQLVIGLFLGYVRVRYGFGWGVLLHGLHNLAIVFPVLLLKLGSATLQESIGGELNFETVFTETDTLVVLTILLYMLFMFILVVVVLIHAIVEAASNSRKTRLKQANS